MENPNLVDIDGYENYKFDTELQQVYNIKRNRYLKNKSSKSGTYVALYKNGERKNIRIYDLIKKPENPNLVDIVGYEGLYKFDIDLEQVFSIKRNRYKINTLRKNGYYHICLSKNKKNITLGIHQIVYLINNPLENLKGFDIDHIDGNPQNNKIENLRKCSHSDNCSNRKVDKSNTSGYKNITQIKYGYRFELMKNKIKYAKNFKTLEEAITYRDITVREKCGEFANLE